MATLVFVYGTGVRLGTLQATEQEVRTGLENSFGHRACPELATCLWGDPVGVNLHPSSRTLPLLEATKGQHSALWEMLSYDPCFELRALSEKGPAYVIEVQQYHHKVRDLPGESTRCALVQSGIDA